MPLIIDQMSKIFILSLMIITNTAFITFTIALIFIYFRDVVFDPDFFWGIGERIVYRILGACFCSFCMLISITLIFCLIGEIICH